MSKLISVIVTNYNHAKYLEQAIASVVDQTYLNLEIIVIDDCSTDGSQELIRKIASQPCKSTKLDIPRPAIKTVFLEKNMGKWFALNTAIAQATGELITLQDADDVSCPGRIARQYNVLMETKTVHNLCGFYHCYSQEDIDKYKDLVAAWNDRCTIMSPEEVTAHVFKGYKTPGVNHYYTGKFEVHGATCLFYKQLWIHGMKFLPGNMGLRCQRAEDSDFNTKMTLLLQKTSILKEQQYCYRRNTSTNPAWLEEL